MRSAQFLEQVHARERGTMPHLFPNSVHVVLHTICGYPFMVNRLEEEARIGGVRKPKSELTDSFLELLWYEDLQNER
jgi:hypothetical protein